MELSTSSPQSSFSLRNVGGSNEYLSDDEKSAGSNNNNRSRRTSSSSCNNPIEPPLLVYHENARSIVFRDHLRRATAKNEQMESQSLVANDKTPTTSALSTEIFDAKKEMHTGNLATTNATSAEIAGFQPRIRPLPSLELGPSNEFELLLQQPLPSKESYYNFTIAEREVISMLKNQECVVKTIKNDDWTAFLKRFHYAKKGGSGFKPILPVEHSDIPPTSKRNASSDIISSDSNICHFNSFVTSTSLLPENGKKMRCFGSTTSYTSGVLFALPKHFIDKKNNKQVDEEDEKEEKLNHQHCTINESAADTKTWSWPAGYSAKTEFNIDSRGNLINGREQAMVSISELRELNNDYTTKNDYMIGHRMIKGGFKTVPYNELFVRVGGLGRIVNGNDFSTGYSKNDELGTGRSFDVGLGLPIAIFVRTATYGHLISMLRTRARMAHVLGESHFTRIPLLYITPELGVRVLTESLQHELLRLASKSLNPFQNPMIAHKIKIDGVGGEVGSTTKKKDDAVEFEQKLEELIHLDDSIRKVLTPEECARIAGGFGATDDSVAMILKDAMLADKKVLKEKRRRSIGIQQHQADSESNLSQSSEENSGHTGSLQDIVNEGLASAVRSGDYYTSRQLLILYTLVASTGNDSNDVDSDSDSDDEEEDDEKKIPADVVLSKSKTRKSSLGGDIKELQSLAGNTTTITTTARKNNKKEKSKKMSLKATNNLPAPPPPPPLDTDRLRSATNSDGLLAVLGAAQVLKAMQEGSAQKRTEESILALDEWIEHGENSMVFRLASWNNQRAAQRDLKIAMEQDSNFMAFVSNKAISNRKKFSNSLRYAVDNTDFTNVQFLKTIHEICKDMHSPCLRLELLQYVLGIDNRYSVAHVERSIQLAATCLNISSFSPKDGGGRNVLQ